MRTNVSGLVLSIGMSLIVLLLGFGALSAVGLVGFSAEDVVAENPWPDGEGPLVPEEAMPVSTYVPTSPGEAEEIKRGDALFQNNCAQCHAVNEKVVGPALAGITKRRTISWLIPWVKNSSRVIASGDEYAVKTFNDNGRQQMPAFPNLTDQEIKSIIAWVSTQETARLGCAIVYGRGYVD